MLIEGGGGFCDVLVNACMGLYTYTESIYIPENTVIAMFKHDKVRLKFHLKGLIFLAYFIYCV